MSCCAASDTLYASLLGPAWESVASCVQAAHEPNRQRRGTFTIRHGASWLAHRLARWSGLPQPSESADTRLRITQAAGGEHWDRSFNGCAFRTFQWSDNGRLLERVQGWELQFALHVEGDGMVYRQTGAWVRLGPLRLPVPLVCAPRVFAREEPADEDRVHVTVTVSLPLLGLLIAYDGHLDTIGGAASE